MSKNTKEERDAIRELLALLGYNQATLAGYLGVNPVSVGYWLSGARRPMKATRILLMQLVAVGRESPDLLRAFIGYRSSEPVLLRIKRFYNLRDEELVIFLEETLSAVERWHTDPPSTIARLADVLELVSVFRPGAAEAMRDQVAAAMKMVRDEATAKKRERKNAREVEKQSRKRRREVEDVHEED